MYIGTNKTCIRKKYEFKKNEVSEININELIFDMYMLSYLKRNMYIYIYWIGLDSLFYHQYGKTITFTGVEMKQMNKQQINKIVKYKLNIQIKYQNNK